MLILMQVQQGISHFLSICTPPLQCLLICYKLLTVCLIICQAKILTVAFNTMRMKMKETAAVSRGVCARTCLSVSRRYHLIQSLVTLSGIFLAINQIAHAHTQPQSRTLIPFGQNNLPENT